MTKATIDDYTATLSAQLKEAGEQMRLMRNPPKQKKQVVEENSNAPSLDRAAEPFDGTQVSSGVSDCHQVSSKCHEVSVTVDDSHLIETTHQKNSSFVLPAPSLQQPSSGSARHRLLETLTQLHQVSPRVIVNLKRLALSLGLSYGTVRNTLSQLARENILQTEQVRTGESHGVCVRFLDDSQLQSVTPMAPQALLRRTAANEEPLWSTDADMLETLWPHAVAAGLHVGHLAQLRRAYQIQGWKADAVPRCLRYLDWELQVAPSKQVETSGNPDPVLQWLRIMQRHGSYPEPEGYPE